MQSSSSDRVNPGRAAVPVNAHRAPGSQMMNSSSTVDPGIDTCRRAPTPEAAPVTVTLRTIGNHSGQRAWSASTAKTSAGDALDSPWASMRIGAWSIHSIVRGISVAMAPTLLSRRAAHELSL